MDTVSHQISTDTTQTFKCVVHNMQKKILCILQGQLYMTLCLDTAILGKLIDPYIIRK